MAHRQYTGAVPKDLTSTRDIYENNANVGARRMRSAIYRILPRWFTDEAEDWCRKTLRERKSGVRFDQRLENIVAEFSKGDITERQLVSKVGRPRTEWTTDDVVELEILFRTLARREITRDDAFPPERVTGQEIIGQAAPGRQASPASTTAENGTPAVSGAPGGGYYDPQVGATVPRDDNT